MTELASFRRSQAQKGNSRAWCNLKCWISIDHLDLGMFHLEGETLWSKFSAATYVILLHWLIVGSLPRARIQDIDNHVVKVGFFGLITGIKKHKDQVFMHKIDRPLTLSHKNLAFTTWFSCKFMAGF